MKKTLLALGAFALSTLSFAQVDTITAHLSLVTSTPTFYTDGSGGYVSGNNSYGDLTKMQLFDGTHGVTGNGYVNGVLLWAPIKVNNGGSFQVAVWADNAGTPAPMPLGFVTMTLASVDTTSAAAMLANGEAIYNVAATFSTPILIPAGNKFWAGIVLPTTAGDTLALVSSTDGDFTDAATHTGEFQAGGVFHTFNDGTTASWGLDIAMAIYPVVNFVANASITENEISASVYPNPATDVLNIKSTEEFATIVISTMDGKIVANGTSSSVNVADLNAGMYLYTATTISGRVAHGNFAKN